MEEIAARLEGFKKVLEITEKDGYIIVKTTAWVSGEDFAKISTLIKEFNGERIQAGKESHWRIPASKPVQVITVCPHCGKDIFIHVERR